MKKCFKDIPYDQPNKDFYANKVCRCVESTGRWCRDVLHYKLDDPEKPYTLKGYPVPISPVGFRRGDICGLPVDCLEVCYSCQSVFYNSFIHANQPNVNYNDKYYCWHCLEAGISDQRNWLVWNVIDNIPPAPELLNPYCKPLSEDEKLDRLVTGIDTVLSNIDSWDLEL